MKKKWIFLIIAIILVAGIFFYLKFRSSDDFEPLIKEKLQQLVKDGSNGLYRIDIESIKVDVVESKVVANNVHLSIDSVRLRQLEQLKQAPNDVYKIQLKDFIIEGIGAADLIKKKDIDLNSIYITDPVVEVFHHKRAYNYKAPDTATLYERIAKQIGHFSVKNLVVQNVDFTYHNVTLKDKQSHFRNVNITFADLLIDSTTKNDSTRFFYSKDADITFDNYTMATPDSLYNLHVDSVQLNASSRTLQLTSISLKPRGKKEEFSSKLPYYKDRYDIDIQSATIQKIDWWQILSEESFTAKQVQLGNGNVEVFADRTLPAPNKSKVGNYPHQLLMRLQLPVMIDTIKVKNFKVTFTELNEKTKKRGSVVFDDISGAFANITNMPDVIAQNKYFSLEADAKLMSAGALHALFKFDLANAENGNFSLDMTVGSMDGKLLNKATIPLGLFEIKNAEVNKITAHMNATNNQSTGTVAFYYKNLEVEVLKPDEEEKGKVKKRGLISFIANSFIIEKSNTPDDKNKDPKHVTYKRDPRKSFFNLIWKTLFTGLGDTVKGTNE